jgi:ATP-dependent DNA helicase RecQ
VRIFHGGVYRENLRYSVRQLSVADGKGRASARAAQAKLDAVRKLLAVHDGPGIVYTATVREAEHVRAALDHDGVAVALYHGRMPARERHDAQERFMNGAVRVMVATNAFGMGIDKPDVRYIVHYQMPGSVDAYYQETRRDRPLRAAVRSERPPHSTILDGGALSGCRADRSRGERA